MLYPTIGAYDFAVINMEKFVLAPQFKNGIPIYTTIKAATGQSSNTPMKYSGGYSVVYPIKFGYGNKKIALRCWLRDAGHVRERYKNVKEYLAKNSSPYFVEFGYVEDGILVNGNKYPVSYMEWIEGWPLSQFLDEQVNNSDLIKEIAEELKRMVSELHKEDISHGDLQDGNIMVYKSGSSYELKLVDYDSIYVPTLPGTPPDQDILPGIPEYQHPKRNSHGNEKADYFSELVIYLSLCAYAERPSLWKAGQEKKLLFSAEDFKAFRKDPSDAAIYKTLKKLPPHVQYLTDRLIEFCREKDTNKLLPLEEVLGASHTGASAGELEWFFEGRDSNAAYPSQMPPSTTPSVQAQGDLPKELVKAFTRATTSASSKTSIWDRPLPLVVIIVAILAAITAIVFIAIYWESWVSQQSSQAYRIQDKPYSQIIYDVATLKLVFLFLKRGTLSDSGGRYIENILSKYKMKDLKETRWQQIEELNYVVDHTDNVFYINVPNDWTFLITFPYRGDFPSVFFRSGVITMSLRDLSINFSDNIKCFFNGKAYVFREGKWIQE